ncbi:hypothetical protein DFX61_08935 [Escherichia coli]|nr:hypothetical protein [Escherichia coli]
MYSGNQFFTSLKNLNEFPGDINNIAAQMVVTITIDNLVILIHLLFKEWHIANIRKQMDICSWKPKYKDAGNASPISK